MNNFKDFVTRYRGAIIGGIIGMLILLTNLYRLIVGIILIFIGMFVGNYVQHNKYDVKENESHLFEHLRALQRFQARQFAAGRHEAPGVIVAKHITRSPCAGTP